MKTLQNIRKKPNLSGYANFKRLKGCKINIYIYRLGGTDVEAETPILWPPDARSWLIWKDPDAGKDWGREQKGTTEDEMVGWHHWLNGHGFGWTLGVGDGQGGLACCGSWGRKKSDTTERLTWNWNWCTPIPNLHKIITTKMSNMVLSILYFQ